MSGTDEHNRAFDKPWQVLLHVFSFRAIAASEGLNAPELSLLAVSLHRAVAIRIWSRAESHPSPKQTPSLSAVDVGLDDS